MKNSKKYFLIVLTVVIGVVLYRQHKQNQDAVELEAYFDQCQRDLDNRYLDLLNK